MKTKILETLGWLAILALFAGGFYIMWRVLP